MLNRLLDVIHRRADRENQLELFLVFEYLERDLADYISHLPTATLIPSHQIQVIKFNSKFILLSLNFVLSTFSQTYFPLDVSFVSHLMIRTVEKNYLETC